MTGEAIRQARCASPHLVVTSSGRLGERHTGFLQLISLIGSP
jgi:hypothetical protein